MSHFCRRRTRNIARREAASLSSARFLDAATRPISKRLSRRRRRACQLPGFASPAFHAGHGSITAHTCRHYASRRRMKLYASAPPAARRLPPIHGHTSNTPQSPASPRAHRDAPTARRQLFLLFGRIALGLLSRLLEKASARRCAPISPPACISWPTCFTFSPAFYDIQEEVRVHDKPRADARGRRARDFGR